MVRAEAVVTPSLVGCIVVPLSSGVLAFIVDFIVLCLDSVVEIPILFVVSASVVTTGAVVWSVVPDLIGPGPLLVIDSVVVDTAGVLISSLVAAFEVATVVDDIFVNCLVVASREVDFTVLSSAVV